MGDMMIRLARSIVMLVAAASLVTAIGCGKKKPPVAKPTAPPPTTASGAATTRVPAPPEPVSEPTIVPAEPVKEDTIASGSLDEINRNSPLKPVYFALDSSDITPEGRSVLDANAAVMKKYPSWTVTIEGHTDERGTAEYNLALGERRAVTARAYLVSLGVSADRLRTVSYGKEFPFDPGHDESAFSRNRRAHFVITAK
jgi:peptidoglycan-associated lipoprotein